MPFYMQCNPGKVWPTIIQWIVLKCNINEAQIFAMKTDSNVDAQCLKVSDMAAISKK